MHRRSYLRGRLLLAGVRLTALELPELVDVAEAAMLEPALNGSYSTVDTMLDTLEEATHQAYAVVRRETWGTSRQAQERARAAEAMFGPRPARQ